MISAKRCAQRARSATSVGEQVAHVELEVLEVHPRARRLGLRVGAAEAVEQAAEQGEHWAGVVIGARRRYASQASR